MESQGLKIPKEPGRMWHPKIKPLSSTDDIGAERGVAFSTIGVARRMPELCLKHCSLGTVRRLIQAKMHSLGLPTDAVTAYVNYAGHNTLSVKELAKEMRKSERTIREWFSRLRSKWPQLFTLALRRELDQAGKSL